MIALWKEYIIKLLKFYQTNSWDIVSLSSFICISLILSENEHFLKYAYRLLFKSLWSFSIRFLSHVSQIWVANILGMFALYPWFISQFFPVFTCLSFCFWWCRETHPCYLLVFVWFHFLHLDLQCGWSSFLHVMMVWIHFVYF